MTIDPTIRITDIIMILAVFIGPIVAVYLTELRRKQSEGRDRKENVFRTLMATRNATLDPNHVQALNVVDVLFHSKKERKIVDSWKLYISHLNDQNYPKETWAARRAELLLELLYEMGSCLGYSFDKSHIKSGTYYPGGYSDADLDNLEIRKLWLAVLRGKRQIPMRAEVYQNPQQVGVDNPSNAQE